MSLSYREALLHLDGVEEVETKIKKKKKKKRGGRSSSSSSNADEHFEYLIQKENQISSLRKDLDHYISLTDQLTTELAEKDRSLKEMKSTAHHLSDIGAQEMNSIRSNLNAWKKRAEELARDGPTGDHNESVNEKLSEALAENSAVRKQLDNLLIYQLGIQPNILEPLSTLEVVSRLERVLESVDQRIGSLQDQQECVLTFCDIITGSQDMCIPFLNEFNQKEKAINSLDGKLVGCSQKVLQSLVQLQHLQQSYNQGNIGVPSVPLSPNQNPGFNRSGLSQEDDSFTLQTRPSLCIQIWYALNELAVAVSHVTSQFGMENEYAKVLQNAQQRCVWIVRNLFTSKEKDSLCVDRNIYSNTTANPPDPPTAVQAIIFQQQARTSPILQTTSPLVSSLPPKMEIPGGYILQPPMYSTSSPLTPLSNPVTQFQTRHSSPFKASDSPSMFIPQTNVQIQGQPFMNNAFGNPSIYSTESPRVQPIQTSPFRTVTELGSNGYTSTPIVNLSRKAVEPMYMNRAPTIPVPIASQPESSSTIVPGQRNAYCSPMRRTGAYQSPQRAQEFSPMSRPVSEYALPPGGPVPRQEVRRSSSNQPAVDPRKAFLRHPRVEFEDPNRRRVNSSGRLPVRGRTASTSS